MLIIGSHVSFDKDEQLVKSVKEAISYGSNTFMFYTGAPQNTRRSEINDFKTLEALQLMKENNIDYSKVIVHAPYIINLANNKEQDKFDFSVRFLKESNLERDFRVPIVINQLPNLSFVGFLECLIIFCSRKLGFLNIP